MNEDEEIRRQIAEDEAEHDRDFTKLSAVKKCPRCDSELSEGYLILNRETGWKENKPGFFKLSGLTKPMTWRSHAFPSLRCLKCHFVTFDYTIEVEKGTVKE